MPTSTIRSSMQRLRKTTIRKDAAMFEIKQHHHNSNTGRTEDHTTKSDDKASIIRIWMQEDPTYYTKTFGDTYCRLELIEDGKCIERKEHWIATEDDFIEDDDIHKITFDEYMQMIAPELAWDAFSECQDDVSSFFDSINCKIELEEFYFNWGMPFATVDASDALVGIRSIPIGSVDGCYWCWMDEAQEMWIKERPKLIELFDEYAKLSLDDEKFIEASAAWYKCLFLYEKVAKDIADEAVHQIKMEMDFYATEEGYEEYCLSTWG